MSNVVNIRVSKAEKERLRSSANAKGVSLSAFLRSAATTEAHRVNNQAIVDRIKGVPATETDDHSGDPNATR